MARTPQSTKIVIRDSVTDAVLYVVDLGTRDSQTYGSPIAASTPSLVGPSTRSVNVEVITGAQSTIGAATLISASGIADSPPTVVDITYSPNNNLTTVTPVNFAHTFNGTVTSRAWVFKLNGNTVGTASTTSPSFTFMTPGAARVELTLTGPAGIGPTHGEDIGPVTQFPNNLGFTVTPTSGAAPLLVTIDNTTTAVAGDVWSWTFGDGNTSTAVEPGTHTYTAAGTYTIGLSLTRASITYGPVTQTVTATAGSTNRLINHLGDRMTDHLGNFIAWS